MNREESIARLMRNGPKKPRSEIEKLHEESKAMAEKARHG
jgi:hypothetical protein